MKQEPAFVNERDLSLGRTRFGEAEFAGSRALFSSVGWTMTTVVLAAISLVMLLRFKSVPEPVLILGAGIAGVVLHHGS